MRSATLQDDLKKVTEELDSKKSFMKNSESEQKALQSYKKASANLDNEKLYDLRVKIRAAIRELISKIELTMVTGYQVYFKNGSARYVSLVKDQTIKVFKSGKENTRYTEIYGTPELETVDRVYDSV